MENKNEVIMRWLPYILAALASIVIIVVHISMSPASNNEEVDYEQYAKEMVESSEIMANDIIYRGVYTDEEIASLPEGFVLSGTITEVIEDGELTKNYTSTAVSPGYEVYTNTNDLSKIYLRVTTDEDEVQSYLEYVKKEEA